MVLGLVTSTSGVTGLLGVVTYNDVAVTFSQEAVEQGEETQRALIPEFFLMEISDPGATQESLGALLLAM
jgi:hypothetical protein